MICLVLWVVLLKRFTPTSSVFALVISLVGATLAIVCFAQVYKIEGDSMARALQAHQTVLVYKFEKYHQKGAAIVYKNAETGKQTLGRIRGVPDETITHTAGAGISGAIIYKLSSQEYYVTADNLNSRIPNRVIKADSIVGTIGPKL